MTKTMDELCANTIRKLTKSPLALTSVTLPTEW